MAIADVLSTATPLSGSFTADNAIAAYVFVKLTATGCDTTTSAGPIGVTAEAVASGGNATIFHEGEAYLIVNGNSVNIAAGDYLKATTAGYGVKSASDGDEFGAIALEPATTDAKLIRVLLKRGFRGA